MRYEKFNTMDKARQYAKNVLQRDPSRISVSIGYGPKSKFCGVSAYGRVYRDGKDILYESYGSLESYRILYSGALGKKV